MFNSDDAFGFEPGELNVEIYQTLINLKSCIKPRINELGESYLYDKWDCKTTLAYMTELEAHGLQEIGFDDVEVIPNALQNMSDIVLHYFASLNLASDGNVRKQHLEHEDFDYLLNSYKKLVDLTVRKWNKENDSIYRNLMDKMSISLRTANEIVERWHSGGEFSGYFTSQTSVYRR